ncbi:uncharacterized protein VTP21DRAFT_4005 [Calcarisporiella thermophila]|uniref:uncharacterized protein n=1 Tax=Calcarisporiella thermophila TaxID=911321 RepID=UPI0037424C31
MYWRFGFHNPSAIDGLLEKEDVTLEDLLDEDDLLQECKSHNAKLLEYLRDPAILGQLFDYIISDELEERQRFKYPYLACEIFSSGLNIDAVTENWDLLARFWKFLDRPSPLNSLQSSYFNRVICALLSKKTAEMLEFIKSQGDVVNKFLFHIETSAIVDLLVNIIRLEELPEGAGVVDWLDSQGIISKLIEKLDPNLDPEVHSTAQQVLLEIIKISQTSNPEAPSIGPNVLISNFVSENSISRLVDYMLNAEAPHSTSTLINTVPILIDLIRHNNADYILDPNANPQFQKSANIVDLSPILRVLTGRLGDFQRLLVKPNSWNDSIPLTVGKITPLGFERLKICELLAELLHCSNMTAMNIKGPLNTHSNTNSSPVAEGSENPMQPTEDAQVLLEAKSIDQNPDQNAVKINGETNESSSAQRERGKETEEAQNTLELEDKQVRFSEKSEVVPLCDDATEAMERDKLVVGDLLKQKFIEHRIVPTCLDLFFEFPWNNFLHYVVFDIIHQVINGRMDQEHNRSLLLSLFTDGQLTKRIVEAQRRNDIEAARPRGTRFGYMGHLTGISDEILRLSEEHLSSLPELQPYLESPEWVDYLSHALRETKERDLLPLGGARPALNGSINLGTGENEDFVAEEGSTSQRLLGDQFGQYMTREMTNNFDEKFWMHGEEDDDDEEDDEEEIEWMGDFCWDAEKMRSGIGGLMEGRSKMVQDDDSSSDEESSGAMRYTATLAGPPLTVADWNEQFYRAHSSSSSSSSDLEDGDGDNDEENEDEAGSGGEEFSPRLEDFATVRVADRVDLDEIWGSNPEENVEEEGDREGYNGFEDLNAPASTIAKGHSENIVNDEQKKEITVESEEKDKQ